MDYLYRWFTELYGRSGVGMSGVTALSYSTVYHWAVLTGRFPRPYEVEGLMALDAVARHPEAVDG